MNSYILFLTGAGLLILGAAWLPLLLRRLPLSLPMLCVVIGFCLFSLPDTGDEPLPFQYPEVTERFTEFVVVVALMGAGLKLDTPLSFRGWMTTWRLLVVSMPLTILGVALLGWWMVGLAPAAALLLGAALAPTDPVLAADVQVGPPRSGEESHVRFSLTSEAGLNDGLAFPFVNLALAMAAHGASVGVWTLEWLAVDVFWKLAAGIGVGWAVGWALGLLAFRLPGRISLSRSGDGFVALGVTLLAYGLAELVYGYGFLAVFAAALALRRAEREHDYHDRLHDFAEQIERLAMMALLVLFGGALASGLLWPITWAETALAFAVLFIVRPAAGLIGLLGAPQRWRERLVISFFGIRGVGSVYYLAYGLNREDFGSAPHLWAVVALVILVSIFIHGTAVTPVMRRLDGNTSDQ
jgi:NhaP-type Na+/H+ or K+/H+ antiporter